VAEGDLMQLSSRRGTVRLPARRRDGVLPGMIFVPFHWGDEYSPGNNANYLTISAIGRIAKQPELKFCAVSLEKLRCPSQEPIPASGSCGFPRSPSPSCSTSG
jgi:anaerobic selenocysteine-containing dehydrogenase